MFRKTLLAVAASIMTLGAFSGTLAVLPGSAPSSVQIA
jgi:hypothetical protein